MELYFNKTCIAVNQDPAEQGKRLIQDGDREVWGKKLQDGSMAVLLMNRSKTETQTVELNLEDLGFTGKVRVQDIYSGEELGEMKGTKSKELSPYSGWFIMIK